MRPVPLAASLGLKSVPHTLPETLPNIPALYPLGQFVMYYLARSLFEYPFRFPIVSLLGKIPKGHRPEIPGDPKLLCRPPVTLIVS